VLTALLAARLPVDSYGICHWAEDNLIETVTPDLWVRVQADLGRGQGAARTVTAMPQHPSARAPVASRGGDWAGRLKAGSIVVVPPRRCCYIRRVIWPRISPFGFLVVWTFA
jgi:hypothetical protein